MRVNLVSMRMKVDRALACHDHAKARVLEETEALEHARLEESVALEAQQILQNLAEKVQLTVHQQVARVVSRCLSGVFEEPYELVIEFDKKRGKTEATFAFYKGSNRVLPRVTSGGVRDVVSLALRIVSLLLSPDRPRRLLVLDEPFRGVSAENLSRVAALLDTLAEELDFQFIIVTHNQALEVGDVIRI
jgi:ABC-type glutathione transport system ATPase component